MTRFPGVLMESWPCSLTETSNKGQVVETFIGVRPESDYKLSLDKLVA